MDVHSAFQSVIALFAFWIAIYYLWRDFRHDAFREDIFTVRDEMFLFAAEGNITFNHPAYTIMRDRMNALLRHGHDLTLTRLMLLAITCRNVQSETTINWNAAVEQLPPPIQQQMKRYNLRVSIFVLQHVFYCSFFRYLAVRPFMNRANVYGLIATPAVASGVQQLENRTVEEDERMLDHETATV